MSTSTSKFEEYFIPREEHDRIHEADLRNNAELGDVIERLTKEKITLESTIKLLNVYLEHQYDAIQRVNDHVMVAIPKYLLDDAIWQRQQEEIARQSRHINGNDPFLTKDRSIGDPWEEDTDEE